MASETRFGAPHQPPLMSERRQFGRRRLVWHAWIITAGARRTACIVRNISRGGALLELEVPAWLPNDFTLALEDSAITALCDLRHRGRHGVGVSFRDAAEAARLAQAVGAVGMQSAQQTAVQLMPPQFPRPHLTRDMVRRLLQQAPE